MTQAICDITTDEVNVDVVVEPQADTMVEVANRAGGMEQVFHDETLIGNGNSIDLGVNTDLIATKEYVDEKVESIDTYTKDQIDGKLTAVDAQIDANADAIQKTREDYIQADSELQTQITAQAAEIAKKQDELIAGDNITIVDNVISATGGGGGGGIANVIHDATLTGSGTNASPLGLAEAIKDEIADKAPTATVDALTAIVNDILTTYLKKTGDTMTGALNVPEFTVSTAEGTLSISVVAGVPVIASNNGMDIASRVKFDYAPTTDDSTTYANALEVSLMRKAQVATAIADAVSNIDALPDQTGNAGKVLTTDGSTASWQEAPAGGTKVIIKRYS